MTLKELMEIEDKAAEPVCQEILETLTCLSDVELLGHRASRHLSAKAEKLLAAAEGVKAWERLGQAREAGDALDVCHKLVIEYLIDMRKTQRVCELFDEKGELTLARTFANAMAAWVTGYSAKIDAMLVWDRDNRTRIKAAAEAAGQGM